MSYEAIEVGRDGKVGILAFDRDEALNAFSPTLIAETNRAMAEFNADDQVNAILVKGNGRCFSAGFDMKAAEDKPRPQDPGEWEALLTYDFDFIMQFWHSPKPTVAAVHRYCFAGAMELALACDVTVAAAGTRFGEPEVRFSSGIVAMLLPWVTGPKQAKELLLTGDDRVSAERACEYGLINRVVAEGEHEKAALRIARDMAAAAPNSVRKTKQAVNRAYAIMGMDEALKAALDIDVLIESTMTPEKAEFKRIRETEGLKAALAWRDAKFKHDEA